MIFAGIASRPSVLLFRGSQANHLSRPGTLDRKHQTEKHKKHATSYLILVGICYTNSKRPGSSREAPWRTPPGWLWYGCWEGRWSDPKRCSIRWFYLLSRPAFLELGHGARRWSGTKSMKNWTPRFWWDLQVSRCTRLSAPWHSLPFIKDL